MSQKRTKKTLKTFCYCVAVAYYLCVMYRNYLAQPVLCTYPKCWERGERISSETVYTCW